MFSKLLHLPHHNLPVIKLFRDSDRWFGTTERYYDMILACRPSYLYYSDKFRYLEELHTATELYSTGYIPNVLKGSLIRAAAEGLGPVSNILYHSIGILVPRILVFQSLLNLEFITKIDLTLMKD